MQKSRKQRMMKRRIITIDECLSMSTKELFDFVRNDAKLVNEHPEFNKQPNIDFQGLTHEEILKKFECVPAKDARQRLLEKTKI